MSPNQNDEFITIGEDKSSGKRLAVASTYLYKLQRRHFFFFNLMPLIGTVLAMYLALENPIGWLELTLFGVMWMLTGLGISTGYHRLLCHRSFRTTKPVRIILTILGCMAAQGSVISWVAMHRRHHQITDREGDIHSPNLHGDGIKGKLVGFFHAHLLWMFKHDYPNVTHYAKDLLKDPAMLAVNRYYVRWVLLGIALPTVIGGIVTGTWYGALMGMLWGGAVRLFVVGHLIATLNSLLHLAGTQRFVLNVNRKDNSRNNWLLGLLVWGEGWHNNHHAFPFSASFGLEWYRVDFGYYLIKILQMFGLAWDIKLPNREIIRNKEVEGAVKIN